MLYFRLILIIWGSFSKPQLKIYLKCTNVLIFLVVLNLINMRLAAG